MDEGAPVVFGTATTVSNYQNVYINNAAGADVTVVDISERQLDHDRKAGLKTLCASLDKLDGLEPASIVPTRVAVVDGLRRHDGAEQEDDEHHHQGDDHREPTLLVPDPRQHGAS